MKSKKEKIKRKKLNPKLKVLMPLERIENKILIIRERKVILDSDLARLYGVETRVLKQAVRRNIERFPNDFMFKITKKEKDQVITICDNSTNIKFSPTNPWAFTEQGVAMLSSVLNSPRAIQVNIAIMRAFTKLRELMISHKDLAHKIEDLERKYKEHDKNFTIVFQAIRKLLEAPKKEKRSIGFHGK